MNSLVVYDSQYGNTEQIARAIATRLEALGPVHVMFVREPTVIDLAGIDLLVIGGPTQSHGASRQLRDWVEPIPAAALRDKAAATFDTRLRWPAFLAGSAGRAIARTLERAGARLLEPPESFLVVGSEGPLADGELDRAGRWATALASLAADRLTPAVPLAGGS
ncbi:MAG TPA: flavodoxin domain-containing protein [Thermomicrobiaceae bacterium]|nr:flavodoxin domain-containing protein [Thermomicrobiaceae bacterium]